jgi:alkylated DNA repair dioxygenase AlkB
MSAFQSDLFGAPLLEGLAYQDDSISPDEERALIAAIGTLDLTPFRFHSWEGRRLTMSLGWAYAFDDARLHRAAPIPAWLLPLRAAAAGFAGLRAEALVQALVTRYDPGAVIGWHRDRPVFEHIIGISLGAPAKMRFRRRRAKGFDRAVMPLAPRSAYHLAGEARHAWEHSIGALESTRWSITFRSLSEQGGRVAGIQAI